MAKSRRNRRNTRRRTMKGGGFFGTIFGSVAEALGLRKAQPVVPVSQPMPNIPKPVNVTPPEQPKATNQILPVTEAPVRSPNAVQSPNVRRNNVMPNARRANNMNMGNNRGRLAAQGIEEAGGPAGVNQEEAYNELMGRPTYGGLRRKSRKSRKSRRNRRNRRCY